MKRLAGREAEEWAEEQAELQAEDLDVTALQKRRLATFGNVPKHWGVSRVPVLPAEFLNFGWRRCGDFAEVPVPSVHP
jgi:hypothetical protein